MDIRSILAIISIIAIGIYWFCILYSLFYRIPYADEIEKEKQRKKESRKEKKKRTNRHGSLDSNDEHPYNYFKEFIMKHKKIISILIIATVIFGVGFPFIMDHLIIGNPIASNIGNSEWVSFLGSYIGSFLGGILAIIGVIFTIQYYKGQEVREKNVAVKPILDAWHLNGSFMGESSSINRRFDYALHTDGTFHHCLDFKNQYNIPDDEWERDWLYFELLIHNIGNGPALDMRVLLQSGRTEYGNNSQSISVPKNSLLIYGVCINKSCLSQPDNRLLFTFTDIYRSTYFKQEIKLSLNQDPRTLQVHNLRWLENITLPEKLQEEQPNKETINVQPR